MCKNVEETYLHNVRIGAASQDRNLRAKGSLRKVEVLNRYGENFDGDLVHLPQQPFVHLCRRSPTT